MNARRVAVIDQREFSGVAGKLQVENRAESSVLGAGLCEKIGVPRFVEDELAKIRSRTELAVFGTFEGSREFVFCELVRIKNSGAVGGSVMNRDPFGVEGEMVSVHVCDVLRFDRYVVVRSSESDRTGMRFGCELQCFQLSALC